LQAIADAVKLAVKEMILPVKANKFLFLMAPAVLLALSFVH
jgi:NADH:ubiquinone oxidoreductase subunit H